ncbi:hypothetical protein RHSP_83488 [Rhizobium freirei PRF 81]|uniref:Uncharacterized protein n=2 Tax=Rhizobium TaxID=379 RepID=N6V0U5_9HYPH|nr:hypothetical protein RTCIAT899_PB02795 [Rhizobium tropici CIAT 899]AYG70693.1 hypothetical protein CCGE531_32535 [Rhizobium sp. CCGE531]AYG77028.1 hypothetical protein CCGE532_31690 [Rhizobium sp. CCGE532]ENN86586.1 hypothetical protein RHSP_83488 [Rhizobium freirei PRF 81]NEV14384.1 hypothetical protein [Rhizobium tropici]TGE91314.1 hypothetical protein C9417_28765 [Rhizobium sp. SEMIA 4088]
MSYSFAVSGRAHRGLDGCRKDRGRSVRTRRAEMKWRAARRSFVAPRGMSASRSAEESFARPLREDDRGEAGLRSDMPHRAREGRGLLQCSKGYGNGSPSPVPARTLQRSVRCLVHMPSPNLAEPPSVRALHCPLRAIAAPREPSPEDLYVSRQSRLSSKSSRPGSSSRSTGQPRSGANWTSRLIVTRPPTDGQELPTAGEANDRR